MVLMIEDTIEGIPAIHAAPADRMSQPLPTIFFFHGYRSSKSSVHSSATCWPRVILPEAPMHGARFDGDDTVRLGCFWDILKRNIDELPLYRDHYEAKGLMAASASAAPSSRRSDAWPGRHPGAAAPTWARAMTCP